MATTTYLHVTHMYSLDQACRSFVDAFGWRVFLVGSALYRRDWHDVDVRCILDDEEYSRMFPGEEPAALVSRRPRLALMNAALSEWLRARTGLPVDFQFQQQTAANSEFNGLRSSLGVFVPKQDGGGPTPDPG